MNLNSQRGYNYYRPSLEDIKGVHLSELTKILMP